MFKRKRGAKAIVFAVFVSSYSMLGGFVVDAEATHLCFLGGLATDPEGFIRDPPPPPYVAVQTGDRRDGVEGGVSCTP